MQSINTILDRNKIKADIIAILKEFDTRISDIQFKKGIYIYGNSGAGISHLINEILTELNYDTITYSTEHIRNKMFIQTINSEQMSTHNIYELMHGKKKRIAILMDEIEGMNNGDKGGISALIKLIRQKKTKKQKLESHTTNPIICVGNCYIDKKIRELMKVCHVFEIKTPTNEQITQIMRIWCPTLTPPLTVSLIEHYINGDFRKMVFIRDLIKKKKNDFIPLLLKPEFQKKYYIEDSKKITKTIMTGNYKIREHERFMNETDRTIVALLWHENVPDILPQSPPPLTFYTKLLDNMCFADFIDRITFQNQVWIFNEMSSIMKTFYNQFLLKKYCDEKSIVIAPKEIRFTKVLTKYSTEYNNTVFIYNLCQGMQLDKKDVISMFQELQSRFGDFFFNNEEVLTMFEKTDITKLDLKRMSRYLQKNIKPIVKGGVGVGGTDDDSGECGEGFGAESEDDEDDEDNRRVRGGIDE
jgi:hypothetical protein